MRRVASCLLCGSSFPLLSNAILRALWVLFPDLFMGCLPEQEPLRSCLLIRVDGRPFLARWCWSYLLHSVLGGSFSFLVVPSLSRSPHFPPLLPTRVHRLRMSTSHSFLPSTSSIESTSSRLLLQLPNTHNPHCPVAPPSSPAVWPPSSSRIPVQAQSRNDSDQSMPA
jgi:hypothetical protein